MKKSIFLLCGLALIALIIGYTYKEPDYEEEAVSEGFIEYEYQSPTRTLVEKADVNAKDEEEDEMATSESGQPAEEEEGSGDADRAFDPGSYYEMGREVGQEVKEYIQEVDWDEKYDKAKEAGKEAADFLNDLFK